MNPKMSFNNHEEIEKLGFQGFIKMNVLFFNTSLIPKTRGVYFILYPNNKTPEFIEVGTGGHFKGKDPNVSLNSLKARWVEKTIVIYIGKAGSGNGDATLQKRLKHFIRFGQGESVGHWGGRLIWQLKNSKDLIVCWKTLSIGDPRTLEKNLILEFKSKFDKFPFANLTN